MFSVVSVCHSVHRGSGSGSDVTGGHHWRPVQSGSLEDLHSGTDIYCGHRNTYSRQVGSTHPTGMLSC